MDCDAGFAQSISPGRPLRAIALAAVASLALAFPARGERNLSATPPAPKAAQAPEQWSAPFAASRALALAPLSAAALEETRKKNLAAHGSAPLQVGVVRALGHPERVSTWKKVPGGMASQWQVHVAEAKAIRLGLEVRRTAPGVRARIGAAAAPHALVGQPLETAGPAWSPLVAAGDALFELFVPDGVATHEVDVEITTVVDHFLEPADAAFGAHRELAKLGSCLTDLVCHAQSDPALARAGTASIKITWVEGAGAYACSATLLNPADRSFRPYIYTAAHCVGSQRAADSLVSHWFYERAACGGTEVRGDLVQLPGGARLLAVDAELDASFLRLNLMPPAGVTYAGWDSEPPAVGETVTAIHHANGGVTKVSRATVLPPPPYPYIAAAWKESIVQGGSSGSGLFTRLDAANPDFLLRGTLSGTSATCTSPGLAVYSRLDKFWPKVAPYLSTGARHANLTGLWANPDEPGWGLQLNHQGDVVFGVLFLHASDGRPEWLVASEMRRQGEAAFEGALYRMTGPAGGPHGARPAAERVGSLRVALSEASQGEVSYTLHGRAVSGPIARQRFAGHAPVCVAAPSADRSSAVNYQDLWWDPADPGFGLAIAHQSNIVFATVFTYDTDGAPVWYVASDASRRPDGLYAGALYRTEARAADAAAASLVKARDVGNLVLAFRDGQSARATFQMDGRSVTRELSRQVFGASAPRCD